jgi:peptidoglycan/xylan/chitin deacetylase (PgdA/CDA1 family)
MTRILLSVDTEADNQWDADARARLSVRNIAELPRLQKLCDTYGVTPIYLLTHEVAVDRVAKEILRELAATGRCEIGSHHHPWTTPPQTDGHLYPLNLVPDHYRAQLKELTRAVTEVTGNRPVSYRAGRNGFAGWQVEMLEEEGYLIESSVDPFFNERRKGGPSFAGAPTSPYFVSRDDPRRPGPSKLLEVPITSAINRRWPRWLTTAYADVTAAYQFRRALRLLRVVRPIWLRPSYSKTEDMLWLADSLVAAQAPVATIIFHSSELLPGGSPYNVTPGDVDKFYQSLEILLERLVTKGAKGATFREFRDGFVEGGNG